MSITRPVVVVSSLVQISNASRGTVLSAALSRKRKASSSGYSKRTVLAAVIRDGNLFRPAIAYQYWPVHKHPGAAKPTDISPAPRPPPGPRCAPAPAPVAAAAQSFPLRERHRLYLSWQHTPRTESRGAGSLRRRGRWRWRWRPLTGLGPRLQ